MYGYFEKVNNLLHFYSEFFYQNISGRTTVDQQYLSLVTIIYFVKTMTSFSH